MPVARRTGLTQIALGLFSPLRGCACGLSKLLHNFSNGDSPQVNPPYKRKKATRWVAFLRLYGGSYWIRTSDQLVKSQLLYQLS